jgi:hypothetical protein
MVTRNNVRIGDLAAGTLLVYTHSDTTLTRYSDERRTDSQLDAGAAEVLSDLLQRWPTLDSDARRRIARTILQDPPATTDEELRMQLQSLIVRGTQ